MTSLLVIARKKSFEEDVTWPDIDNSPGEVLSWEWYPTSRKNLRKSKGLTLFVVTVRPGRILWLVAIYEETKPYKYKNETGLVSTEKNTTPITDITHLHKLFTFDSGNGLSAITGQALQTPRVLTKKDEKLLRDAVATATTTTATKEDTELSDFEGEERKSFVTHRKRESKLRDAKVAEVKKTTGKLCCETPGCGFDFLATYGKLGEDYIQVHHKKQLAKLEAPEQTKLSDLVVVCANCHVMIHRGGKCRELKTLLPLKKSPKKKV
jgi:hypothetical protein